MRAQCARERCADASPVRTGALHSRSAPAHREHGSLLRASLPGFGLGLSVVTSRQFVTVRVDRSEIGQTPCMYVVGFRVLCYGFRVQGLGFRVRPQGSGGGGRGQNICRNVIYMNHGGFVANCSSPSFTPTTLPWQTMLCDTFSKSHTSF